MVQRVHVVLEDDIDGQPADETVMFALDGVSYEIDLSTENATKLRDAMALYVGHGRRVSASRGRSGASGNKGSGPSAAELRQWAINAGYELNPRGRVPNSIREAYEQAHG